MKIDLATKERFARMVRKDSSGSWLWKGAKTRGGYGTFFVNGRSVRAHKFSFELINGPVPKGYDVHHVCWNRACVNPNHLESLPHSENVREAAGRGVYAGERNSQSRLSDVEVLHMRILHDLGESVEEIAERFTVKKRNVYYIFSRQRWSHIDFPENLPPVTLESVKATIGKASQALKNALAVYRENGWPIREEDVNTVAACERVLGR